MLRDRTGKVERGVSERESRFLQRIQALQKLLGEANECCRVSELKAENAERMLREQRVCQEFSISHSKRQKVDTSSRPELVETEHVCSKKERDLIHLLTREREESRKRNQLFKRETERKEVKFRSKLCALESQLIRERVNTRLC